MLVVPLATGSTSRDAGQSDSETGISYTEDGENSYNDRLFIMPESLSIDVQLRPQIRHRGIYEAMLYTAETTITGTFAPQDLEALKLADSERLQWDEARIEVYVLDNRGIIDASDLDWNGVSLPF